MASKQLWRWHGITGDGNAQDGMLWAESRALLLMALQQQMVTPLSLSESPSILRSGEEIKARKSFINWRRCSKPG